ncbi:MAG: hypothetical protein AAFQ66_03295 [Pseudomonadota bacterium]
MTLLGDHATDWQERLGLSSIPEEESVLTLVLVDAWSKLNYMSDVQALCGTSCAPPAFIVRTFVLRPGGSRKVVVLLIKDWQDEQMTDACLDAVLRAEITEAEVPECASHAGFVTDQYLLPLGLGHW